MKAIFSAGNALRALWLARWLLVLVLMWDQIGSPLHHHQHDSGVDAQWIGAAATGGADAIAHVEADDHDSSGFAHAILAVRIRSGAGLMAPVQTCVEFTLPVAIALLSPDPGLPIFIPTAGQSPPASHRSLPPAGRAPPLHA